MELSPDPFFFHGEDVELVTQRQSTSRDTSLTCTVFDEPTGNVISLASVGVTDGTVDLTDDGVPGEVIDLTCEEPIDDVVDLTIDESNLSYRALHEGEYALASCRVSGSVVERDDCVEVLDTSLGAYKVSFVIVKAIVSARPGSVIIRGIPLSRTRDLAGMLPKKRDEVCQVLHINRDGGQNEAPGLIDVNLSSVVAKRAVIMTNSLWPKHSSILSSRDLDGHQGSLVCRWSFRIYSTSEGRRSKPIEEALERIQPSEVINPQYRDLEDDQCYQWRGGRVPGGSWRPEAPREPHVDIVHLDAETSHKAEHRERLRYRQRGQKYTVFDSFCGAGGVSRGAQTAGMIVTHAVDKSEEVCETYRANFRETRLYIGSVDEFVSSHGRQHFRVDVLHLSPPCQFFSPAHTHTGVNDDINIFALFSCNSLINKVRPRIVTVEQTFGLTHDRHREYFHSHLNDFTQLGYSVRWRVVKLCTWGSAQSRKRLIMIAAAPGEKLPPFPEATHSENGDRRRGLKPYTTIRQAISTIRPRSRDELHNLHSVRWHHPPRASYCPDRLAGTLTTGGPSLIYPDGTRDFTLREQACLQGFPHCHTFKGTRTSIKRQIGNAFPPNTVTVLYKYLEKWLLRQDGVQPSHAHPIIINSAEDTVTVADDEDSLRIDIPRSSRRVRPTMPPSIQAATTRVVPSSMEIDDKPDEIVTVDLT
ncbi:DNA (cytosine-5)-methyltransferase 1 [Geosmithia morbida]|uniref:DNA (cytosine-5-)-methyltransferase n=1 Tax=Geosmithia morbida TaxID=1094350 RepID=A0A9P5D236_9HYPO|nr:DNA (cytosine-5)-methyltransferase 1 [Geosmithia morbida]KAF4124578.1 DNA (cytosine-5)-methyltransferase 1 [Geosmithia morbida]